MGIAVLSGVIDSLGSAATKLAKANGATDNGDTTPPKWESHTPGTTTPTGHEDTSVPSRFIACVNREESARNLEKTFASLGPLGETVEVFAGRNLAAVQRADVVLLWYVSNISWATG